MDFTPPEGKIVLSLSMENGNYLLSVSDTGCGIDEDTPVSYTHLANKGMNPNTLQYIMGHANITMTLGYYAHGTFQSAKAELERLAS